MRDKYLALLEPGEGRPAKIEIMDETLRKGYDQANKQPDGAAAPAPARAVIFASGPGFSGPFLGTFPIQPGIHSQVHHVRFRLAACAEILSSRCRRSRRAHRHRRSRHQIQEPHRPAGHGVRQAGRRSPACSRARNARRRRSISAAPTWPPARRGCWSSIPAMPMPSPARRAASRPQLTGEVGGRGRRLQRERSLPRLDRRHRRAARCRPNSAHLLDGHGRATASRTAGPTPAKAIMTTDTYPKVATAHGQARRRRRDHQRHRQGRRHDRA